MEIDFDTRFLRESRSNRFRARIPKNVTAKIPPNAWFCNSMKVSGMRPDGVLFQMDFGARPMFSSGQARFVALTPYEVEGMDPVSWGRVTLVLRMGD